MPTYEEVLARLDKALAVASDFGLGPDVQRSWFYRYRDDLERLMGFVQLGREGRLTPEVAASVLERRAEYVAALSEGQQFGEILEHLADLDADVLKPKLRDAMRGPVLPSDEDPNSNHARNTLFELALAAQLRRAGFRPSVGDRPDVGCEIEGERFAFECKRVFSEKKLAERIAEAGESLCADLEAAGDRARAGVIVISAAKLFSPAQVPFPIRSERAAKHFLNCWLEAMAADTESVWSPRIHDGPVVGIMFQVFAVFENEERNRFDVGEWWLGVYSREAEAAKGFRALGEALKATAY